MTDLLSSVTLSFGNAYLEGPESPFAALFYNRKTRAKILTELLFHVLPVICVCGISMSNVSPSQGISLHETKPVGSGASLINVSIHRNTGVDGQMKWRPIRPSLDLGTLVAGRQRTSAQPSLVWWGIASQTWLDSNGWHPFLQMTISPIPGFLTGQEKYNL